MGNIHNFAIDVSEKNERGTSMSEKYVNPNTAATRTPICLCLDLSGSVSPYINLINNNVAGLYEAISDMANELAVFDIAQVTFGGMLQSRQDEVKLKRFEQVGKNDKPLRFEADEKTLLGAAVKRSMDCLDAFKNELKRHRIHYYQPILVIVSDGQVNDEDDFRRLKKVQEDIREKVLQEKLLLITIGVGDVNLEVMSKFSPNGVVLHPLGIDFKQIITPLVASIRAGNQDAPYNVINQNIGKMPTLLVYGKKALK